MSEVVQLNLFGDVVNFDNLETNTKEVENDSQLLGTDGSSTLGKISSEEIQSTERTGDIGEGAGESRRTGERDDSGIDGERSAQERSSGDSASSVYTTDTGEGSGTENNRLGTTLPRSPGILRNGHTDDRGNYHITDDDDIGSGGKVSKFESNLSAIHLLKKLTDEKRYATPEEQSILVKYTGWGGLSEVFKENLDGPWLERQKSLKSILTPDEYKRAARSTLNAHYSDPNIVDSIWTAVTRMGYNGGPTLEPATGIGHFFGKRPHNLPIEMHGIELDPVSGRIAQQLYQSADIKITGYEDVRLQENRYNLIISNVPFGDYKPYEEKQNRTPGLDNRSSIHDFYFLKSLYGLREGGLIAFITSRYTLDKEDTAIRERIAEKADFIGAIRLPNNAFKQIANTEVVTDVVFLQKRPEDQEMSDQTKKFIHTANILIPDSNDTNLSFSINQYFIDHPEMVIGKHDIGSMYSGKDYTVSLSDNDLKRRIDAAISFLPENIMNVIVNEKTKHLDDSVNCVFSHIDISAIPRGSFVVGPDNRLYQKSFLSGKIELSPLYQNEQKNKDAILRIMLMSSIRDCVKEAIDHYHNGQTIDTDRDLSRLNSLYDNFVKEHGFLNSKKNVLSFNNDPDSALLQSLEKWDPKTKTATKADIFEGIAFVRKEPPTFVESPVDAMALSLSRYGKLNMSYMESLTGTDQMILVNNLLSSGHIYQDPYDFLNNGRTTYFTANHYLSGNIREKIKLAKAAAEKDPTVFSRNVQDLSNVLPIELGPQDISLRLNSPIVGEEHVKSFISDLLDVSKNRIDVIHISITGKWEIKGKIHSIENDETYGTYRLSAIEIIDNLMNGKPVRVYSKGADDQLVLDTEATAAAELKAEAINREFSKWIWKDQNRTDDIVKRYNEVYNSTVERKYTHPERIVNPDAKIFMHGCNFPFPLRPNQADAVWRIIQEKNTMLAHTVGAGKTMEMACAAMELRRLGIRNKPMIVCPDHMIGQWASEFREAYPAAKLLIADDNNWSRDNRRTFINKIATGDWDAVLIRAESFKMIPMSDEYQKDFFKKKIAEYRQILENTDSAHKKSRSVKDLEKAIEKYEIKIKELTDSHQDEGVIPFDKLGIDHLFIDEADIYKNLEYYTQLQNVRGLGTPKGSERAIDMLMKIRHIQENDGGVTFATGTPISNTLVEAYTMQRFLQPEVLKANGLEAFDEWARQYAESVTQMELNNTGTGYKPVTRFSKIVNVPELVSSLRQTWDIQTAQNLEKNGILVPGVNLPHMKIINEAAPCTPLLQSYLKYLEQREKNLSGKAEKGKDNVLSIMTDGRKAAIDMRFINPHLPDDPRSKLNLAVKVINDIYNKYKSEGYTCAVFFDKSRSFDSNGSILFDGVDEIKSKLIANGVSPSEIGDVRDCKTFEQRQQLFEKVREGKCRIIFGSTESMGAGTNFQQKLKAIVHIDAPWRPRDIEQQNGRGYRPGNKTGELEIYNLVTKGSLDTGLWNVLETKANSIRQVMDGSDKNTREIDENYYGTVKDLSIDNELMKEAVELDHSLKKLRSYERSFNNDIAHIHRRIQLLPSEIEKAEDYLRKINQDLSLRQPEAKGDKFSITIGDKVFLERKEAGEVIKKVASSLFLQAKAAGKEIEKEIGSYSGFPVLIKSTMHDPYSIARIVARAPNFCYSSEIRSDSDPSRLCVSFHSQLYKSMDKMLENSKSNIEQLKNNLSEYSVKASAVFPKAEELKAKEARYIDVMTLLKKEAEKAPKQEENHYNIPWKLIGSMPPEDVKKCVQAFYDNIKIEQSSTEKGIKTGTDIANFIKKSHNFSLPPSIIAQLDAGISSGDLQPEATFAFVADSIEQFRIQGYSWRNSNIPNGTYSAYCIDQSNVSVGDICVRSRNIDKEPAFEAFRICDNNTFKYLGTEKDFAAIQSRVEQYVLSLFVRDKINETISIANSPLKVQEERAVYGVDI